MDGSDVKGCMPKVCRNDDSFNSSSSHINGRNKSVIWAQKVDDDAKGEVAGWPSWETNGKAKKVTGEGGDAIHHDGWRQSSPKICMVEKNSLSKSACWDGPGDCNVKQETGGWSRWPAATSKTTTRQSNQSVGRTASEVGSNMASKRGWNEGRDGREKGEIGAVKGCMRKVSNGDSFNSSSSHINGRNKSVIWAQKVDDNAEGEAAGWPRWEPNGKAKRVTGEGSDAIRQDGLDGWRQSIPKICMMEKGSSSKSACWGGPANGNVKRETGGWSRWPASTSKTTTRQSNQYEGRTASEDESTMACKRGWNDGRGGREKWDIGGHGFDHNGCDGSRRSLSNNHSVDKGSLSKSASWDRGKHENLKRGNDGWHRWPGAMSKTTERYAGHQNRKDSWNESERWATSENFSTMACKRGWNESGDGKQKRENGGDALDHDNSDGWRQSGANKHVVEKGRLRKSASWDLTQYENAKSENDGWRGWPGVMSKTNQQCGWITKDGSIMAGARGWNVSGDGKERREVADGGDTFDHDGRDGPRPSSSNIHTVDKRSLSKSASWDLANDDNTKIKNDGFPRWPGALSKTIGQIPSHQNKKLGWQSQGWTQSDHGDSQKESGGRNPDLVQSDDPWMQRGSTMSTKCDWNASKSWNALNGDNLDREQSKWDPGLDRTGGDPWEQIHPAEPSKANMSKFGSGAFAQGEDSIIKSKWIDGSGFSDPDGSKQHRLRWASSMMPPTGEQCPSNQNGPGWNQSWGGIASEDGISLKQNNGRSTDLDRSDDSWMKHRPLMLQKCDWKKSAGWNKPGENDFEANHRRWGPDSDQTARDPWEQLRPAEVPKFDYSIREKNKKSGAPDFDDANALNQNMHTFLPNTGGKRPFRSINKTPCHPCEQEHYQSDDAYKKEADVSAYYGDSPSARSERTNLAGYEIGGDAFPNHPDRDTDEFWDSKKARYLGHDWRINFKDPWKHGDHLEDKVSLRHKSHNDGAKQTKLFQKEPSSDRFLRERCSLQDVQVSDDKWDQKNIGKALSPWNIQKGSKTNADNSPIQPHLRRDDEGFRDDAITATATATTLEQNVDHNVMNSPHALRTSSEKLAPAVPSHFVKLEANRTSQIHDISRNSTETMNCPNSRMLNTNQSEPAGVGANLGSNGGKYEKEEVGANEEELKGGSIDDKGIRRFKFALAEFVKEIIKPVWKEGRLSKEAHKAVVKRVVDKVVAVLGANIPQTQERIDLYFSYDKDKLHKLVQGYLEMFIKT